MTIEQALLIGTNKASVCGVPATRGAERIGMNL